MGKRGRGRKRGGERKEGMEVGRQQEGMGGKGGRGGKGRRGVTAPKHQFLAPTLVVGVKHAIAYVAQMRRAVCQIAEFAVVKCLVFFTSLGLL